MSDTASIRLAERYASDPEFKRQADEAMGVFHIPSHPKGECRGCDNAREKGLIENGS